MIVMFAKEDDDHALAVKRLLEEEHQEQASIFDTSRFPTAANLSAQFGNGSGGLRLTNSNGSTIDLAAVKSFWWRRPQSVSIDQRITDAGVRNFAYSESLSALYGILDCCGGLWVNDIHRDDAADYKPRQLKGAIRAGFRIPETLMTNDPQQALDFWRQHNGNIVYKAFNQHALIWTPTRRLRAEDLNLIHNVSSAPVIFQSHIQGNRDIRITIVGKQIFAAEFQLQGDDAVDYRLHLGSVSCEPHTLSADMVAKLEILMSDLGLEYSAIDFRLTPDNQYVFFEVNTGGEFLYVQSRTGQPIAEAVSFHLARGKATPRSLPVDP